MKYQAVIISLIVTFCGTIGYSQDDWELRVIGGASTPGQAQAVASYNHYGYVADTESGVTIFNIFDPTFPVVAGSYNHGGIVNDIIIEGHLAYLAHWSRGVSILNITTPVQPESVVTFNTPGTTVDIYLDGDLLYAADLFNGVVILDVSSPPGVFQVGHIPISGIGAVGSVAAEDTVIYVASQGVGILTYNLADTLNPVLSDNDLLSTDCNDIVIYDNYLLLACGQAGMIVYNITDRLHPDSVTTLNTIGSLNRIAVKDTIAYLADGINGLVAVNITNPGNPAIIQTLDTPGTASGVGFYEDFVLLADRLWLLVVYYEDYIDIEESGKPLPDNIQIINCYPNPFNASTRINFELRTDAQVALNVYDIRGRLVKQLADAFYSAGNYAITWDGGRLPSGVYFLKLSADDDGEISSSTTKVLYLK
jgi:hypothetical protein